MTAEQRAGLSDAALAMTQPCIDELIKDISRRVQKAGAITDTAEYQLYRAQALGESKKAIEQAVSKQIGISGDALRTLEGVGKRYNVTQEAIGAGLTKFNLNFGRLKQNQGVFYTYLKKTNPALAAQFKQIDSSLQQMGGITVTQGMA